MADFADYYREIYARGLSGESPTVPVAVAELERRAEEAMSEGVANYVFATAGAEATAGGDAPRWFQLYWSAGPELTESFVKRAEDAGLAALPRREWGRRSRAQDGPRRARSPRLRRSTPAGHRA